MPYMKQLLQEESIFFNDINLLSEKVEYTYMPKIDQLLKSHPDAAKLRKQVQDAESLIKEKELSEVQRKKGWQILIRFIQIVEDLNTVTCFVLFWAVTPLFLNLWYRLCRYWADSVEVNNEIKYAKQAIEQLKKLEKKATGKDKERMKSQIAKLEKTIKDIQ